MDTVDIRKHCELCDHQLKSWEHGSTCALTNKSPDFNRTCFKIALNSKFEEKVKDVNIAYQKVKSRKVLTYVYFFTFLILGIMVIIMGYHLFDVIFSKVDRTYRSYSVPPFVIIIGLGLLFIAIPPFMDYHIDMSIAKQKKEKLDALLALYGITYTVNVTLKTEKNGVETNTADLKIHKKSYQVSKA